MFRSDDLYREMNYMIENLSPLLLNNLTVSAFYSLTHLNLILTLTIFSFYSSLVALYNSVSRWDLKRSLRFAL